MVEGLLSTGPTPSSSLPLGRDWVTITFFSNILRVKTRLVIYEKKPPEMFEMNQIMFRPHLDLFIDVCGLTQN